MGKQNSLSYPDIGQMWNSNEWDPLEEVIVGNPTGARFPFADLSTRLGEDSIV